ncbi:hypothetical protein JTB14_005662 [Gonioctena quinquepunctata]|nr:hypothetical protein JTB14_005662 [Gonioctena quinquepunctata]
MPGEPKPQAAQRNDPDPSVNDSLNSLDEVEPEQPPTEPWDIDVSQWEVNCNIVKEERPESPLSDEEQDVKPPKAAFKTRFMPGSFDVAFSLHKPKIVKVKSEKLDESDETSYEQPKVPDFPHQNGDIIEKEIKTEEIEAPKKTSTYAMLRSLNNQIRSRGTIRTEQVQIKQEDIEGDTLQNVPDRNESRKESSTTVEKNNHSVGADVHQNPERIHNSKLEYLREKQGDNTSSNIKTKGSHDGQAGNSTKAEHSGLNEKIVDRCSSQQSSATKNDSLNVQKKDDIMNASKASKLPYQSIESKAQFGRESAPQEKKNTVTKENHHKQMTDSTKSSRSAHQISGTKDLKHQSITPEKSHLKQLKTVNNNTHDKSNSLTNNHADTVRNQSHIDRNGERKERVSNEDINNERTNESTSTKSHNQSDILSSVTLNRDIQMGGTWEIPEESSIKKVAFKSPVITNVFSMKDQENEPLKESDRVIRTSAWVEQYSASSNENRDESKKDGDKWPAPKEQQSDKEHSFGDWLGASVKNEPSEEDDLNDADKDDSSDDDFNFNNILSGMKNKVKKKKLN